MVSFTFDDFPSDALSIGGQILESAGYRGTYYVSSGLLGTKTACGQIADGDDLKRCIQRGHELANHTLSHVDCTTIEKTELIRQVEENRNSLPPAATRNFAYPFGSSNLTAMRIISSYIATGRGIEKGINARGTNTKRLRANPIYSCAGVDRLLTLIEQNMGTRGWLIFYTHDVNETPSQFGCTPEDFRAVVAAVKGAQFDVVTIEEGRRRLNLN
jgi:peptidoglycan/xylan/chitin deacetylase (PgdA/CDA1 family)